MQNAVDKVTVVVLCSTVCTVSTIVFLLLHWKDTKMVQNLCLKVPVDIFTLQLH